jgi:hypothetical protein
LKGHSGLLSHSLDRLKTTDQAYLDTYQKTIIDGLSANIFDNDDDLHAPAVIVEQLKTLKDGAGNTVQAYQMDNTINLMEPNQDEIETGINSVDIFIRLGRAIEENCKLDISAPAVSAEDKRRGIQSFLINGLPSLTLDFKKAVAGSSSVSDWNVRRKITITAITDSKTASDTVGLKSYTNYSIGQRVGFIAIAETWKGATAAVNPVKVVVHDQDHPEVVISEPNGPLTVHPQGSSAAAVNNKIKVKLSHLPTGTVRVTLNSAKGTLKFAKGGSGAFASELPLTFDNTDYWQDQEVTVCAADNTAVTGVNSDVITYSVVDASDIDANQSSSEVFVADGTFIKGKKIRDELLNLLEATAGYKLYETQLSGVNLGNQIQALNTQYATVTGKLGQCRRFQSGIDGLPERNRFLRLRFRYGDRFGVPGALREFPRQGRCDRSGPGGRDGRLVGNPQYPA